MPIESNALLMPAFEIYESNLSAKSVGLIQGQLSILIMLATWGGRSFYYTMFNFNVITEQ